MIPKNIKLGIKKINNLDCIYEINNNNSNTKGMGLYEKAIPDAVFRHRGNLEAENCVFSGSP